MHMHNHPLYESPALFMIDNGDALGFNFNPCYHCTAPSCVFSLALTRLPLALCNFQMFLCLPIKKPMFLFGKKKMSPCSQSSVTTWFWNHIIVADSDKGRRKPKCTSDADQQQKRVYAHTNVLIDPLACPARVQIRWDAVLLKRKSNPL